MRNHMCIRTSSPHRPGGTFQNRQPDAIVESKVSGPGRCINTGQDLTRPDLTRRSAMASTPDCRVASASRPAPTGYSVLPLSSDAPVSLAAERQSTLDPTRSHRPVTGTCPVIHGPWTTQRTVEELALILGHRVFRRPIQERHARPPRDGLPWRVPAREPEGLS